MTNRSPLASCEAKAGSRMEPGSQLTDEQWNLISFLFPDEVAKPLVGRPRASNRDCVEGILWILRTGARWTDLPQCFPSSSTCWRRHRDWTESGLWDKVLGYLLRKLDRLGEIDNEESMADAMFSAAKKGVIT